MMELPQNYNNKHALQSNSGNVKNKGKWLTKAIMTALTSVVLFQSAIVPLVLLQRHSNINNDKDNKSTQNMLGDFLSVAHSDDGSACKHEEKPKPKNKLQHTTNNNEHPAADGMFNGHAIYLRKNQTLQSSVHCLGENFQSKTSWIHRSCKFHHLCFDLHRNDFTIFIDKANDEDDNKNSTSSLEFVDSSTLSMTKNWTVSLGGINTKWTWREHGLLRLKWFPKMISNNARFDFYELNPNVVFVPFHSMAGFNPGHLIWDDLLPIYTLMNMFMLPLEASKGGGAYSPILLRYILPGPKMWATCEINSQRERECQAMFQKLLPLFFGNTNSTTMPGHMTTNLDFDFSTTNGAGKQSHLVCAKYGVAGLGMLTDHGGYKTHGWSKKDYETSHNHGRGPLLFEFRNFMVETLGISHSHHLARQFEQDARRPMNIVFAVDSSSSYKREFSFDAQARAVQEAVANMDVNIQKVQFANLSIYDQVEIASQTSIYITACGGGAVTATFVPYGASVILYYVENGGVQNNRLTGRPARLDWDFFNNAAYMRVHWLPSTTIDQDTEILVNLVLHELKVIANHDY